MNFMYCLYNTQYTIHNYIAYYINMLLLYIVNYKKNIRYKYINIITCRYDTYS